MSNDFFINHDIIIILTIIIERRDQIALQTNYF